MYEMYPDSVVSYGLGSAPQTIALTGSVAVTFTKAAVKRRQM